MIPILLALILGLQTEEPAFIARDAIQPCLAADADGGFYCVFIRNGNIEISTSTDDGKTWTAPVTAIDAKGRASGGMQRGPRIGVDGRKIVTVTAPVCFDEKELTKRSPAAELWLARSTDGGGTFSPPVQVNEKAGTAPEALHALAVAPSGEAHIAWLDRRGNEKSQDLYYSKAVDGKPGKNLKLASTVCECCAPGIAVDGRGDPMMVWRDGAASDHRPIWTTRSRNGGKSFRSAARVNSEGTGVGG